MNMIMDTVHHPHHHHPRSGQTSPSTPSVQRADLHINTTTPPTSPSILGSMQQQTNLNLNSNNNNNNNITTNNNNNSIESQISPTTVVPVVSNKSTLKRSFDVAFLMMPDERIKQKQQLAEKQARLAEAVIERHQYPTDLSPRSQQHLQLQHHQHHQQQQHHQHHQHQQQQQQQHLHLQQLQPDSSAVPAEFFGIQEARRYAQLSMRSPRIYDDPSVIIPAAAAAAAAVAAATATATATDHSEPQPMKSAFTKVTAATRLATESPVPPLSPDQLSCPSMSPPVATTPPRTNSGNGSLSNGSSSSAPPSLNPNIVYQNFRPAEYQFNGAFQSVNQVQALQAQRIKQQLFYRPQMNTGSGGGSVQSVGPAVHPPEFLPGYPGFPFPGATAPFAAAVTSPELPRIVQNPAAAAILSTLIPPTLASTFSLTAQNVCAKCNISFRMTSDLVYHMRSHHKSEVACDPNRRKREEKLKCPVCQESFRERHHLTRHMTAHQDKESDHILSNPSGDANAASAPGAHAMLNGSARHHNNTARLAAIPK